MASSKVKLRLCLLAFTLFLARVSVGLGAESESLGSEAGDNNGCVNRCEGLRGKNADEFAACVKGCGVNQRVSPRTEYEVCRLRCQMTGRGEEQQRCQQLCEERLREREQREGKEDDDREGQRRDPEREREERRREEQQREQERHRREQERRERERRGERDGKDDENQRDPDWRREKESREQERRRREQEQREHERRGERDDEDDENQRDPDWRREQERREQERRRREQEQRERERRGERDDEDDKNQRDPDWRREQERREQERRRREQEQREHERRGERDDEDDENQRDPDWRREQERRRREQERREHEHRGKRDDEDDENQRDPDWRREQERRRREQERREREWERKHGRRGDRDENQRGRRGREEQRSREEERQRERRHGGRGRANQVEIRRTEQEQSHNPYYFQEHRFQSRFRSDGGHWRVLERFSELLRGIKNQRLAILEARPQTFIIPHHLDAESVLLVVRGRATITTVVQETREIRKESYIIKCGDVMTVPAGTTIYLANHENEDLQIVKLIQPINNPGEFKDYLSAGGEAQAYYSVFSNDVLEAALNIPRDRLERIFKQKGERRGKIIRASQEQLRALSQRSTSIGKGSRGTRAPIKLESQTPVYSNQYGQMFEACPDEFPQLRRTDVAAAIIDIKQGGMMVPHFNSRATWVVFISEGDGSFEMACPHVHGSQWQRGSREEERHGRREEEERSGQIERVAGRLSEGGVLVIPSGHPIAIMASPNENLRLVGFGINAENNQRNFLAGRENIMNEVDREAKELAFNIEGKQAEEIFKSQRESFFTEGPEGGHRRSTERSPLLPILKLTGYF